MKALLASLALTILASTANAGATNAFITCVSDSGKTKIESNFPGDFTEAALLFSIEGKTLAYENEDHKSGRDGSAWGKEYDGAAVVDIDSQDRLPKSFSLKVLKAGAAVFQMKALEGTMKIKQTSGGQRGKFAAKVQGVDPRHGGPSKVITVNCAYTYEI